MTNRYLTSSDKDRVLGEWSGELADWRDRGSLTGADLGYPDPDILPVCDAINGIPGVVTLQSCAGHRTRSGVCYPAHFWLWMSERMADRFRETALDLATNPLMERVATLYSSWGQEIADITFSGNDCNVLTQSAPTVVEFLRGLGC